MSCNGGKNKKRIGVSESNVVKNMFQLGEEKDKLRKEKGQQFSFHLNSNLKREF